jgi:3-hydroxyisobutyrate dehydrogenase-like beta-hydroxyacid dehydrogenase
MSTIGVQLSKQLAQRHAELGHQYIAAPVFGRPQAAEAKQLGILAAGSQEAIKRARPLLEAMGQSVLEVGEAPFLANTVKLAGNTLLVAMLQALGEAFALVRKSGLSPQHFLEIVNGAVFKSPVYENYGGIIAAQSYDPAGFELSQGLKDLGLVLAAAEQTRTPMPLAALIQAQVLSGMARGWDDLDWSALGKVCAHNAGLDGE